MNTKLEMYVAVCEHFFTMDRPAVNSQYNCMYRVGDTPHYTGKCFVGALIPDELYTRKIENGTPKTKEELANYPNPDGETYRTNKILNEILQDNLGWSDELIKFSKKLQYCHDRYSHLYTKEWKHEAAKLLLDVEIEGKPENITNKLKEIADGNQEA